MVNARKMLGKELGGTWRWLSIGRRNFHLEVVISWH
jgi:hypothetical protein